MDIVVERPRILLFLSGAIPFSRAKAGCRVILPAPMAGSDAEVIHGVLAGAVDRYGELVERYQTYAINLAFSLVGNRQDAEDLVQNAFVKAYEHLERFRGEAKFSTWLHRIVVNECRDFQRRSARRPKAVSLNRDADDPEESGGLFEVADPTADPRQTIANRELAQRLSRAIETLPAEQRTAFVLHHLQGMPLEDVARAMERRLGTVKWYVFRANENLRAVLGQVITMKGSAT